MKTFDFGECLARGSNVVVLGAGGAGKTFFLRYLAAAHLGQEETGVLVSRMAAHEAPFVRTEAVEALSNLDPDLIRRRGVAMTLVDDPWRQPVKERVPVIDHLYADPDHTMVVAMSHPHTHAMPSGPCTLVVFSTPVDGLRRQIHLMAEFLCGMGMSFQEFSGKMGGLSFYECLIISPGGGAVTRFRCPPEGFDLGRFLTRGSNLAIIGTRGRGKTYLIRYLASAHLRSGEAGGLVSETAAEDPPVDQTREFKSIADMERAGVALALVDNPWHETVDGRIPDLDRVFKDKKMTAVVTMSFPHMNVLPPSPCTLVLFGTHLQGFRHRLYTIARYLCKLPMAYEAFSELLDSLSFYECLVITPGAGTVTRFRCRPKDW